MQNPKSKKYKNLLLIPLQIVIDIVLLIISILFDVSMQTGGEQGHPGPSVSLIAFIVLIPITIAVIIYSIVKTVKSGKQVDKADNTEIVENPKPKKPIWYCLIPLGIEIPVSVILVYICGKIEIDSFYNSPSHFGFAIPIATLLLGVFLAIVTLVFIIVTIIVMVKRSRSQSK